MTLHETNLKYAHGARLDCEYTGKVSILNCGCETEMIADGQAGRYIRICEPHRTELRDKGVIARPGHVVSWREDPVVG